MIKLRREDISLKHGCKPTYQQRKALQFNQLDTFAYLVVKSVKNGWQFQSKQDETKTFVCYPDKKGIYALDGITELTDYI